jgi:hypothetical protein
MMTLEQERDAYQWAASKQCILFEKLYHVLKGIIEDNNIQLTKEQIRKINAYNTGNIRAWEHRDEMALDEFPNGMFFNSIMDWIEDDALLY